MEKSYVCVFVIQNKFRSQARPALKAMDGIYNVYKLLFF